MDAKLVKQLKNILDSHFNFSDNELSWGKFSKDWQQAVAQGSANLTQQEQQVLGRFEKEIEDILIHMPGKSFFSKSLDWQKWVQDDDFLRFVILKESIGYSMTISDFESIMGNSLKSGYFRRPYETTADFQKKVCSFIEKYLPARI